MFPIYNLQEIETYRKISSQQYSSNGGIESKVVLDQMDLAKVEEVVDALNFRRFPAWVQENHKTEGNHQEGVAEEPKYLKCGLFICAS